MDIFGSLHMNANECEPYVHTKHDNGRFSIALSSDAGGMALYFIGTPDELRDLADRLRSAAIDAECADAGLAIL